MFWEDLYNNFESIHSQDAAQGYPLQRYCKAFAWMFEDLDDLLHDKDGVPGWSELLSPSLVPDKYLDWLAQIAGVQRWVGMTDDQLRDRIDCGCSYKRGTPTYFYENAEHLGFTKVQLQERYTNQPWQARILLLAAEDTATKRAQLAALIPAGIVVSFANWLGRIYTNVQAMGTYATVNSTNASYTILMGG